MLQRIQWQKPQDSTDSQVITIHALSILSFFNLKSAFFMLRLEIDAFKSNCSSIQRVAPQRHCVFGPVLNLNLT